MPITRLTIYTCYGDSYNSSYMEINVLFDRLLGCKTKDDLVSLCLKWLRTIPDLASNFIPFIQACKKLKYVELVIRHSVHGVDLLLEFWLENRPESSFKDSRCVQGDLGILRRSGLHNLEEFNHRDFSAIFIAGQKGLYDFHSSMERNDKL
ncbi:hypothetical protein AVEN_216777-1 [Araneus ventricosus]|uniref:Uncharacterized protein n=1 Tax=Araneus ventricosus TaxID=182803 RepID=A0A4Y2NGH5_ARAVE|nr:hypothetical protein AVEN_216777-1 [Araneus ventricosus]